MPKNKVSSFAAGHLSVCVDVCPAVTSISRRLLTTSASAALLLAIAEMASGCKSGIYCRETATCWWLGIDDGGVGDEIGPVADARGIADVIGPDVVGLDDAAMAAGGNEGGDAANPSGADADAGANLGAPDVAVADGAAGGGNAGDAPGTDGDAQPSGGSGDGAPRAPPTIVLSPPTLTSKHGGDGGTAYVDACPGSQMVVGYLGTYDPTAYVDSIQAVCGVVLVTGSSTYQITMSPGATLPSHGTAGGSSFAAMCPKDQVVVGIYGHSGLWVDQVGFECAPLTISQSLAISIGTVTQLPASGGPGGGAFGDTCPSGQVAIGSDVASGFFVDSIALRCATPTLVWPDM
jgi:hypothetical protein